MTGLDRFIQRRRIEKAKRFIFNSAHVLDIGCANGALFKRLPKLQHGVGIDPDLDGDIDLGNALLIAGTFPDALPTQDAFDVITMLAVLEHIPREEQVSLARSCFQYLRPGGRLVITVPSPAVDRILVILKSLGLVDGMKAEQHYGYDVNTTPETFGAAGFELIESGKFQMGLNNLFVFTRP
jgi:SAM-dependent methyltransferase